MDKFVMGLVVGVVVYLISGMVMSQVEKNAKIDLSMDCIRSGKFELYGRVYECKRSGD